MHFAVRTPGVDLQLTGILDIDRGRVQRFMHLLTEGKNLLRLQFFIDREETGDLTESQIALSLPSLRRLLGT